MRENFERRVVNVGNKQYSYFRPLQSRRIPLKATSNRGYMPSLKPHLKGLILEYESQLERDFYLLLDHDPNCIDIQPQPVAIPYTTESGREEKLYPDCWAIFADGREFLFEIKTAHKYRKLQEEEKWGLKVNAIQAFCGGLHWVYQVMTEQQIHCVRLNNIKDLLAAAKHFCPHKIREDVGKFESNLKKVLTCPVEFHELVQSLGSGLLLSREEIIAILKYKIYYSHLFLDWNTPLEDARISLSGEIPAPTYALLGGVVERIVPHIEEKAKIISDECEAVYAERLQLISPLMAQLGKEGIKKDIFGYCTKNQVPFYRTYKYYLLWKKSGEEGLIPKKVKQHKKSHLDAQVETVLQEAIHNWNHGPWQQVKAAYRAYASKCHKLGLKPASYEAFRLRIKGVPAVEQRGKWAPQTQSFIPRGHIGTYSEGRYPGAVIQMDHTQLDIWLVDAFTKQPIGRPWLTLGVDVFSRAIWGFFLSFDVPSQESVTQAIISGLTSKEVSPDWDTLSTQLRQDGFDPNQFCSSSGGLPALIQVDNGMDFRAGSVKHMCMDLNISLEFRPIRTPEYGGFIESIWDTINDAIRGHKLKGRVFSLPKSRVPVKRPQFQAPPGYDPRKESCLTMGDFREWFSTYLVVEYSSQPRAHQTHSPNELWRDGLRGDRYHPMGGALRVLSPQEYAKVNFLSKISASPVLSPLGFRYNNILYSSPWLNQARKERILRDGQRYEIKISHWDVRAADILNPLTGEIEVLEAYNYHGDDRMKKFLRRAAGKEQGYKGFVLPLNIINHVKRLLEGSPCSTGTNAVVMAWATGKMENAGKINKIERKICENLTHTGAGAEKISAAKVFALMSDGPITNQTEKEQPSPSRREGEREVVDDGEEGPGDEEIIPFPTDWNTVKRKMIYSSFNDGDEEGLEK